MDQTQLRIRAHRNLAAYLAENARWTGTAEVLRHPDAILRVRSASSFPSGPWNSILAVSEGPSGDPAALIDPARSYFGSEGRGFTAYLRECEDRELIAYSQAVGAVETGATPGLVLRTPMPAPTLPPGCDLRPLNDRNIDDFVHVVSESYASLGLPSAVCARMFPRRPLLSWQWSGTVLHEGREAVACGLLLRSEGLGGLYWIATLPHARGKGYGSLVTRSLCAQAFDEGLEGVVLQASPMGKGLYERIGFEPIASYRQWFFSPDSTAARQPA